MSYDAVPPPRAAEQLLIEALPDAAPPRVLCTSLGRAQAAAAAAQRYPAAAVDCFFLDAYQAQQARATHAELANLHVVCAADLPAGEYHLALIPTTAQGEAEWTRELLQEAQRRLVPGGLLYAATDNPRDHWLHEQFAPLVRKVHARRACRGVVYWGIKQQPLRKYKNFMCRFAFRDGSRLVQLVSRPGVFSHRRLDEGTRFLLHVLDVRPGQRVLDIGCGSGAVALAAACRAPGITAVGVDSNARAVDCTLRGAELNELLGVTAVLSADAAGPQCGTFDVAAGNPPYYSRHRIAELFLQSAMAALRPGGTVLMVARTPDWFVRRMSALFAEVRVIQGPRYAVIAGRRMGA
jgi:16S rRNA G1207 methylase RsmC